MCAVSARKTDRHREYKHAMEVLAVGPHETWMVGDNLEWEIVAPSGSVSTRSGTTVTASGCRRTPDPPRPHHSSAIGIAGVTEHPFQWRCFGLSRAPPLRRQAQALVTTTPPRRKRSAANMRRRRGGCHSRQYTLNACTRGDTGCRASRHRLIPPAIKASCRDLHFIMEALDTAEPDG